MSYRTFVENTQIFGNNESYPEWDEFIRSQGIEISPDGDYEGEITDIMEAIEVIEKIVLRLEEKQRESKIYEDEAFITSPEGKRFTSFFDFSYIYDRIKKRPNTEFLLDRLLSSIEHSYAFMALVFLDACKEKIEREKNNDFRLNERMYKFKLKDGETIRVSAG